MLSILVAHSLCVPSVVHPCYLHFMCVRCCQSLLCDLCVCCLDPWCVFSMHIKHCQSLLCTLSVHLVLSILFTHFPWMLSTFNPLPSAWCSWFSLHALYACLVFSILSPSAQSFIFLFWSFHAWSFLKFWSFEPSLLHLILSMPNPPFPLPVLGPFLDQSLVMFFLN